MNLSGKRILITRPAEQAQALAEALIAQGAIPLLLPTIAIEALQDPIWEEALQRLHEFRWLLFTSANGVHHALGGRVLPPPPPIGVVGPATARALRTYGWQATLVASQAHAMGLLEALGPVAGLSVLLVQGTEARPELADGLRAGGALLQVAHVYQTRPKPPSPEQIASLGRVDLALFASPSALKAFLQAPEAHRLLQSTRLICLGPTTARAAREAGLPVVFVPDQPDPLQALLEAPEEVR